MRLHLAFLAALLSSASPVVAETAPLERILSATPIYLSDGGGRDLAVLVDNLDTGADLYVYLGLDQDALRAGAKPAFVKKNAAWNGGMAGQRPSLAVSDKGSLLIKSENDSIGRDRWSETLTVIRRNGALIVAGFTYAARDTIDPNAGGTCDLNFLAGKGTRNGKKVEIKAQTISLADWSEDKLPKECKF
ncbi:hypothetical protein EDE12_111134 [Methylosinus sp. sav-2]|uniref:hypothetical protein n=1 Tax=Methylosinus sp. sav-2 TaxID=2485168 RepID=UPI00047E9767|nr:hypothetical protein [Methylosinus sp. sav-2]TDX62227.1 hypothetical protein EDE12_111134 [Methylosinus sp. sav-2]